MALDFLDNTKKQQLSSALSRIRGQGGSGIAGLSQEKRQSLTAAMDKLGLSRQKSTTLPWAQKAGDDLQTWRQKNPAYIMPDVDPFHVADEPDEPDTTGTHENLVSAGGGLLGGGYDQPSGITDGTEEGIKTAGKEAKDAIGGLLEGNGVTVTDPAYDSSTDIVNGAPYDPAQDLAPEITLGADAAKEFGQQADNFMNASEGVLEAADKAYQAALDAGKTAQEANAVYNQTIAEGTKTGSVLGTVSKALGWAGLGLGAYNTVANWDDMDDGGRVSSVAGTAASAAQLAGSAAALPLALFSVGINAAKLASAGRNPDGIDRRYAFAKDAIPLPDGRILMDVGYYESHKNPMEHGVQEVGWKAQPTEGWANAADGQLINKQGGYGDFNTVYDPSTNQFYNVDHDLISQQIYGDRGGDWWDWEDGQYQSEATTQDIYDYLSSSRDWMQEKPLAQDNNFISDVTHPSRPVPIQGYQNSVQAILDNADWGQDWRNAYIDGSGEFVLDGFMPNLSYYGVDDYRRDEAISSIQNRINQMTDDNGWNGPSAAEIYASGKSIDETPIPGVNGYTDDMGRFHFWGESGIGG
jgi:hypothetical protein